MISSRPPPSIAHGGRTAHALGQRPNHHHSLAITTTTTRRSVLRFASLRSGPADDKSTGTTTTVISSSSPTSDNDRIAKRAAAAAASLLLASSLLLAAPAPASAVPFPSLLGGGGNSGDSGQNNSSVVRALQERQKRERMFGAADADPRPLLAARISAARAEAARIPLLAKIGQSESARLMLREKNLANLRRDLAYMTGAYSGAVTETQTRGVVETIERLDGSLRRASRLPAPSASAPDAEAAVAEVVALVQDLDERLERVSAAVVALEGEAR